MKPDWSEDAAPAVEGFVFAVECSSCLEEGEGASEFENWDCE